MALIRALRSILRIPNTSKSLLRHHCSSSAAAAAALSSSPSPPLHLPRLSPCGPFFSHRLTSSTSRLFLPPLCGLIPSSSCGPLFLSFPAWKLSQSATPLYLQGEGVQLPRVVPVKLGLESAGVVEERRSSDAVRWGKPPSCGVGNAGAVVDGGILNLPNMISISRMVSGPVIGWMIINEMYLSSFIALAISGMTDWLDGYAARKMNINSVLGSYLDPLADKVLIGCVALAMVKKDLLHAGLVQLVVLRDVGLIGGVVYKRASSLGWKWKSWSDFISLNITRPEKVEPLFISKVNTVFQLILVAAALLQPEFGTEETQLYITYLSWLVASTTLASSVAYGAQHLCRSAAAVTVR